MSDNATENMQLALDGGKNLGINPILSAKQMADPEVDHIGIMAYVAYFLKFKPVRSSAEKVIFSSLPQNVSVGQNASFTISLEDDDVSAGDIRAEVTGPDSHHNVHFNWTGRSGQGFFTPSETGLHKLTIYCENEVINGCPATFKVLADRSKVTFSTVESCSMGTITELQVNSSSAGDGDVQIEARAPSGRSLNLSAVPRHGGNYVSNFNPTEVGEWEISILYDTEHISGSPYTLNVFDPSLVKVYGLEGGSMTSGITFNADTARAGKGRVRAEVMYASEDVSRHCNVVEEQRDMYKINFNPPHPGSYSVYLYFNDQEVRGSPFSMDIVDSSNVTVSGEGLSLVSVNRQTSFAVHGTAGGNLDVEIVGPNGSTVAHRVEQGTNECTVEYIPTEVGDITITLKYGETEVSGSPFLVKAYNTAAIEVTDLPDGVLGQPISFGIDVRKAGEGQLEIMVNNGSLPNTVESDETGVYRMSFTPEDVGQQKVEIIFNKEQHPDSPFLCNAISLTSASVRSLELQHPVERTASFYVHSENIKQALDVNVDILSPNGDRVSAEVYASTSTGEYRVEWMPRVAGRHTIDVQLSGQQIDGSPFYVDVFDLSTIRVDNFRHGTVGDEAGFSVDFSNAGSLEHQIKIIGPSGTDVVYDTRELGYQWKDVLYEPEEPGKYQLYIRYGGFDIPGCPFVQEVADGGLPSASGAGLFFAEEDKASNFTVDVGRRKGDLRVSVSGPNSIAKCSVDPQNDGSYVVTYIPVETGIFDISVTWNGQDIPGSPYHPKIIDVRKVKVIGGWQHFMDSNERIGLVVGERKQLPFDISEAGPGVLRAEVKGPLHAIDVDINNQVIGKSVIEFVPEEEGSHFIHIFWSDIPLVNSPFHGYSIQQMPDASKLILTGRGLKEAIVREEAEFIIDGSQAGKGSPDVVLSGVRAEVPVKIQDIGGGRFRCFYVPTVPGAYLLHITWNGRQLRGSPYKVNVIGAFYPNRVSVSGEGLRGGILGSRTDVVIDTRRAGPGELTAYCMGPHQVAFCELQDNKDGTFNLGVKAQEAGRHVLQIKYGGEHVQGSPFVIKVTSEPDASKVRVHGPGVEHGILATYVSRFLVETRGAGAGQLTVRIRGPKGAFQVEMYRDSQRDRTILCRFDPTECGLYIISVKWSGVDVPGSPFHVHILDTQEELEQVLNDVSYSIGTTSHSRTSSHGQQQPQPAAPRMVYGQWREAV